MGCGSFKMVGPEWVNVDAYDICKPEVVWDLNKIPYPWADESVDGIQMLHVLEHLEDWWAVFVECSRILKPGGNLRIHVPDESSSTALTYRDHLHVFGINSFHGTDGSTHGTSAWALAVRDSVPLVMDSYAKVPHKEYEWMVKWCPWLLTWCARHLRNFIWEQQFVFRKIGS